jgi:cytidylate kinase
MAIDIQKYLAEKYQGAVQKGKTPGPVITISRQYGCSAKDVAEKLAEILNKLDNKKSDKSKWTWINKEIFEGTAKALNLKTSRIQHVFDGEKKNLIEGIILSTSEKYYTSDLKIKQKIIEVVRTYAENGHVIIIGLGSISITRDMPNSLHVKLHAPFNWRVQKMAKKLAKGYDEMAKQIKIIDKKRDILRDSFKLKSEMEELFDVTYNAMTLSAEEIAESILSTMKIKNLI